MDRINFLPDRIRRRRHSARQLRRAVMGLVLLGVALGAFGALGEMRLRAARQRLEASQQRLNDLAARLAVAPQLQKQLADGEINTRISEEVGSSIPADKLLAELTQMLPGGACLTDLEMTATEKRAEPLNRRAPRGARATAASQAEVIRRVVLRVTGLTPTNVDLAEFMAALSNSPLFEDVRMGYSRTVAVDAGRRSACNFEVSCMLTQ